MDAVPQAVNLLDPGVARQDRVSRGLGIAARAIGLTADVYRPNGSALPLATVNRFLRMHAVFIAPDGSFSHPVGFGDAVWQGIFDTAYTQPGDYLLQGDDTWFVARQAHMMPALCVKAERTVTFSRPTGPTAAGVNGYGGVSLTAATPLLKSWPASVIGVEEGGRSAARLPTAGRVARWTVLLPASSGVVLRSSDLMTDDLGREGVVSAAELTSLGWRLSVRQAAT